MKILIDTQSFLWFVSGSEKLSQNARNLIENNENEKIISHASLWEMAIKLSLGKLNINVDFLSFIQDHLINNGFKLIQIDVQHIVFVSTLPFHHRDPFDRLLVSQCIIEKIPIISIDSIFDEYEVNRLW